MNPPLHTPVCDLFGCGVPIVLAGMGGVARSELVTAVTKAGGFGFLGMVRELPELIREEIARVRAATDRDFGVNLIPAATSPDLLAAELDAVIAARVPVVALFWDLAEPVIARLRAAGILVVCQVGSVKEALDAEAAGAQVLIAQGSGAGGHVRGVAALPELLPAVTAASGLPVLAAGGLGSGADLAWALGHGADGIVLGTALLATHESFAHDYHKQRIVAARPGAAIRTDIFHVNWPRGAFVRVLENSVTRGERGDPFSGGKTPIGKEGARTIWLFSTDSPLRSMEGDFEAMALYAGEGAGAIDAIVPAGERIATIARDAATLLADQTANPAEENANAPASPVCYAREAGDAYAGFATREEILTVLNTLLEAERAGARIAARTAAETGDPAMRTLLADIRRDEARWCAMLTGWIARLDGNASARVGDFYGKCLAIPNLPERVAFINHGQDWVVRRLDKLLPRVRDDGLYGDLATMRAGHAHNIARTAAQLA